MTSAAPHTANWTGDVPARTGAFQDVLAVIFRFYPVILQRRAWEREFSVSAVTLLILAKSGDAQMSDLGLVKTKIESIHPIHLC